MISFNTKVLFVDFDKSHFLDDLNDGIWVYRGNKDVNFRNHVMRLLKMKYEEWYKLSSGGLKKVLRYLLQICLITRLLKKLINCYPCNQKCLKAAQFTLLHRLSQYF